MKSHAYQYTPQNADVPPHTPNDLYMANLYARGSPDVMHAWPKTSPHPIHFSAIPSEHPQNPCSPIMKLSDNICTATNIHILALSLYACMYFWIAGDQLPDIVHTLLHVDEVHFKGLHDWFCRQEHKYIHGLVPHVAKQLVPLNDLHRKHGKKVLCISFLTTVVCSHYHLRVFR